MNEAAVIALINQFIYTNGTKDITAAVLNPVLQAMVTQPNDVTGELADLSTTDQTTLVAAINELYNDIQTLTIPLTVHTGSANPNITPPATFEAPDFYVRVQGGGVTGVYIYNGTSWIELLQVENPPELHTYIGGNLFEWRKLPSNADVDNVEPGDLALNGWISDTIWGKVLSFIGGDPNDISSWEILEQIG